MIKYKTLGLAFAVFLAITPFVSYGQTAEDITVTTDKKVYGLGEPVEITVVNNSEESVSYYAHPHVASDPLGIQKKSTDGTFQNVSMSTALGGMLPVPSTLRTLDSEEIFEFTWDQQEFDFNSGIITPISEGNYRVVARFTSEPDTYGSGNLIFYSEEFTISDTTQPDIQSQIQSLLDQIAELQAQLSQLQENGDSGEIPTYQFTRNLNVGMSGEDVRQLQIRLNAEGFTISQTGAGSPGNETTYFGELTRQAVVQYQLANNISPAVGFVGPLTRERLNDLQISAPSITILKPDTLETWVLEDWVDIEWMFKQGGGNKGNLAIFHFIDEQGQETHVYTAQISNYVSDLSDSLVSSQIPVRNVEPGKYRLKASLVFSIPPIGLGESGISETLASDVTDFYLNVKLSE